MEVLTIMIKIKNWLLRPLLLLFVLVVFAASEPISPTQAQQCDYCEAIEGDGSRGDGSGGAGGGGDTYLCPYKYGCGDLGCRAKSILDPTQICTRYVIVQGTSCPSPLTCEKAPK